ncbi:MAG TPA: CheR family methyltransferase [Puia sp.]|nr:CheR family methyltransferase [Puia sp.]
MGQIENIAPGRPAADPFSVVGVGASMGGLEAFKRLVRAIPQHSGMAYILVQHLEPTHESLLPELLQKVTDIPIEVITDHVQVKPDRIYIIPSNKMLVAVDGHLQLSPRPPKNERNMPIDVFFTSLAKVHQSRAIGVVLSGTATDGTLGLKAIREEGGFTFAQEPGSAGAPAMPESAIDSGVVDFILAPEDIPGQLALLAESISSGAPDDNNGTGSAWETSFTELLHLLLVRTGTDFTYYKQTTIRRRVVRRMGLNKIGNITAYLAYFKENLPEQELLYQDLLIPVTGFFRDPEVFDHLSRSVFPDLLKAKDKGTYVRIWVAGCSTGEEAYSMAIALHECKGDGIVECDFQIFASDLSEVSIARARTGLYSRKEVSGLSETLLQRYFVKTNGSYQVNKQIRDVCVFANHNFLKDPPFAKMDLVSCRNVLIYMDPFLQKRALTTFHYALRENGYLLLGNSETVAPAADLFTAVSKHERLFLRKPGRGRYVHLPAKSAEKPYGKAPSNARKDPPWDDFQKSADDTLLSRFTPPGVVVNEQLEIVQFRGATGAWLEPSPGRPNLNVLKMAREGLAFELRNILHKAREGGKPEVKEHIPVRLMDRQQWVTVEVIPLPNTVERYYLVVFREEAPMENSHAAPQRDAGAVTSTGQQGMERIRIEQLEHELAQLREDVRTITEEQEAANEELQSANEELLSGSEELQSLNEELETSKEEIQSTNEELTTLNRELLDRNERLNLLRLYSESIVATIREPLVVVDKDMKVRTANPSFYKKFGVREADTEGRSFFSLGNGQWDLPALHSMLHDALSVNNRIMDFEIRLAVEGAGERIMVLNASRIVQQDANDLLILLAIEDVTEIRYREQDLEKNVKERTRSLEQANLALKHSNESLAQYATVASHDLQEPLRKIRTFAHILNQRHGGQIEGEARDLLQKIDLSAERMSALVQDVLNFAKVLDANTFESVDLNAILTTVIGDFELLIKEKSAVINIDPLPVIRAVPLQMDQLFQNLLGNALKFAKPGRPPVIHITAGTLAPEKITKKAVLDGDGPYVEIFVQDNGIGFDQRFAKQVFQVFQRLNPKEDFEGTGIGLALCHRIIAYHHGEITVESKKDEGTRFRIVLPMEQ